MARDSSVDNQKLLESLHLKTDSADRAKNAVLDLVSKVSRSNVAFASSSALEPVISSGEVAVAGQLQKWRVDVLQRLEIHLPKALRYESHGISYL